jgi:hypothetical protein
MSDLLAKISGFLYWLPFLIGALGLLGIILSIRGTLVARKEAYRLMDKDFLDQQQRVEDQLKKAKQSQKG